MKVVVYRQLPSTESLAITTVGGKDSQPVTATTSATVNQGSEEQTVEYIDMANGLVVTILGWLIWVFIAGLNVYLIVMVCLGRG
jgi:Mn2+/Fe2+ NRAMP family transporter